MEESNMERELQANKTEERKNEPKNSEQIETKNSVTERREMEKRGTENCENENSGSANGNNARSSSAKSSFAKNHKYELWAFFLPFLSCLAICIGNGVYPFGDQCILHVDMYHQYCPFFAEFMDKLKHGKSLFYSFHLGLGSDFVALYTYYLASPLNWLLILWPKHYVIEFMTLTILIKIGLSGLFTYMLFAYVSQGKGKLAEKKYPILAFSTAYALSGFVAAYAWDIMWMDVVALSPLAILGLAKLLREKKALLYYAALALAIVSNYYLAIMLCIFLVFCFVIWWGEHENRSAWDFLRFGWYSLLAGGTGAVLIIPELIILSYSGSSGIHFPEELEWYFDFWQEMSRTCAGAAVYTGGLHWPNLYAGTFSIILVMLYVVNGGIALKRKIKRLALLGFFLLSFANNYLDFIWHGFHFPDSLPGRQSFLFALLVLSMGYETLLHWDAVKKRQLVGVSLLGFLLLVGACYRTDTEITDGYAYVITFLFGFCYLILVTLIPIVGGKSKEYLRRFLFGLAVVETVINMAATGFYTTSRSSYLKNMESYEKLLATAKEREKVLGNAFYRVEDLQRLTKNDDALYGYGSTTQFSSLMNVNVSHFFQKIYMEGGKNFYCYNGSTPLSSAMLGVKYVLYDNQFEESPYRKLVAMEDGRYLYENRYCLPLGYMLPEETVESLDLEKDRIQNINDMAKALGAESSLLTLVSVEQEVAKGATTIIPKETGYFYGASLQCESDSLTGTRSDGKERRFAKTSHPYLLEIGELAAGESYTFTNKNDEEIHYQIYRLNEEAVKAAYETLSRETLWVEKFTDTKIKGSIEVKEAGRLVISIPSEAGWSLYVDGKKQESQDFKETFLGVHLEEGRHEITLRYRTPGFDLGLLISGVSLLLALGTVGISKKRRKGDTLCLQQEKNESSFQELSD